MKYTKQEEMDVKEKNEMEKKSYSKEEVVDECLEYFDGDSLASEAWINKYAVKTKNGELEEKTPEDMHKRMAKEFAKIEKKYDYDLNDKKESLSEYGKRREKLTEERIFSYFDKFKYIVPQGSVMSVLGNEYIVGSLSNCIVIDSPKDSYGGIMFTDEQLVQLAKRRCGIGFDISSLRPADMKVSNAAGSTTGAVSFMERFSNTTREVAQSGRRGALMLTMDIAHPESESFTLIKRDLEKVTGANISLRLSDEFMEAVKKDKEYTHRWPIDSENPIITKTIKARDLWNKIIESAHGSAEPGLIFWDRQHNYSTSSVYEEFENICTNPCLTKDAWVMTNNGPKQIKNLINKPFIALVDSDEFFSDNRGFYFTGNKKVYELTTKSGFSLKSTDNHMFKKVNITRYKKEFEWVELKDLKVGDKLNLNNNSEASWDGIGNRDEGWLLGNLLGDGTSYKSNPNGTKEYEHAQLVYWGDNKMKMKEIAANTIKRVLPYRESHFDTGKEDSYEIIKGDKTSLRSSSLKSLADKYGLYKDKTLSENFEDKSSEFYKGFLSGWFDTDGTVLNNIEKGASIRLGSINLDGLKTAQRMLSRLGIISTVYKNRKEDGFRALPNGKGGKSEYYCKANHELVISKENIKKFSDKIGFRDEEKTIKLENLILSYTKKMDRERFVDEIVEIRELGYEDVYDCTILGAHEFEANGLSVHNCSEIAMGPNDSCRLVALNMYECVVNPFTKNAYFDYEKWYEIAYEGQRLNDDLVDLELKAIEKILKKIESDPEPDYIKSTERVTWEKLYETGKKGRRTGLGFTALGDTLAALGLKYDSNKGISTIEEIMKIKCKAEFDSSIDMSIERGSFEGFDTEVESKSEFVQMLKEDLPEVYDRMMKYGRRNISLSTVAPTGTLSLMAQTSSGIEPVFKTSYTRRRKINPADKNAKVDFVDDLGDKWQEYEVIHPKLKKWMEVTGEEDIEKSPYFGSSAEEIDWSKRIKIQSAVQKYITHSISSTINLPEDVAIDTVGEIYMKAWKAGLKGITVYRAGSRSGVLIDKNKESNQNMVFEDSHAPKRPKSLEVNIIRFQNNLEKWIAFIGLYEGKPYEIFTGLAENFVIPNWLESGWIVKAKDNKGRGRYDFCYLDRDGFKVTVEGLSRAFNKEYWNYAKLISGLLRHGMGLPYIIETVDDLQLDNDHINTWKAGVARALKRFIRDGEKPSDTKCTTCGDDDGLVYEEGCLKCKSCGFSKCG